MPEEGNIVEVLPAFNLNIDMYVAKSCNSTSFQFSNKVASRIAETDLQNITKMEVPIQIVLEPQIKTLVPFTTGSITVRKKKEFKFSITGSMVISVILVQ